MSEQIIHPLHTSCKNCVFSKYENDTQTGCLTGMLEKYKERDIEILEVYDTDKEFFVINDRACISKRTEEYFQNTVMENSSIEEKTAYVLSLQSLQYLAVVDCNNRTPEQLYEVLSEINKCKIKPKCVMVVIPDSTPLMASNYYQSIHKSNIGCKWKIKGNLYSDEAFLTTIHQVINIGAENCAFVMAIGDDYSSIDKIVDKANDMLYKEFQPFTVISNESKSSILFSDHVYKQALLHNADIITDYKEYIVV